MLIKAQWHGTQSSTSVRWLRPCFRNVRGNWADLSLYRWHTTSWSFMKPHMAHWNSLMTLKPPDLHELWIIGFVVYQAWLRWRRWWYEEFKKSYSCLYQICLRWSRGRAAAGPAWTLFAVCCIDFSKAVVCFTRAAFCIKGLNSPHYSIRDSIIKNHVHSYGTCLIFELPVCIFTN